MPVVVRMPIRVALVDDCELVTAGLSRMLAGFARRVEVVGLDRGEIRQRIDIALHDFAQRAPGSPLERVLSHPLVGRRVVYTWNFPPALAQHAVQQGASGVLSKALPAAALVEALERVHGGEIVVSHAPGATGGSRRTAGGEGLSHRESEVVALITQGLSNAEIARVMYLSPNSVKSYIRSAYHKIGVARRSQAVAWGMRYGFHADYPSVAGVTAESRPPARYLAVARPA